MLAICLGRVDLSVIMSGGLISLPKILLSGVQMIAQAGFTQRNITIASLALAFGIGFTSASEAGIWGIFPEIIQTVFGASVVAVVFVVAVFLNLVLPKNMDVKKKIFQSSIYCIICFLFLKTGIKEKMKVSLLEQN